mgnify:CR=1 FL=1
MRFMLIVKSSASCATGHDERFLAEMDRYNDALRDAGILLAIERLQDVSSGARVRVSPGGCSVIDGPFPETKELVGGFWLWKVRSREEALEWARRCPRPAEGEFEIEIREVMEPGPFSRAPGAKHRATA